MKTTQETFINALLADATYALKGNNFSNTTGQDLKTDLQLRMTPILADYISKNFTVVTHIDTPDSFTGSGFDATVWRANNPDGTSNPNGKIYVSMRGTEGLSDFLVVADPNLTS